MTVKTFTVGCAKTINLGNYQSLRIEASVTVEVGECQDLGELKAGAQTELTALLEQTYKAQHKKKADAEGYQ